MRIEISPIVAEALQAGDPVVALESTVITHGLPYPDNLKTAQDLEQAVRDNGATPATIAVLSGKVCIGLSGNQLSDLARDQQAMKVSRRDLPVALAMGNNGGTTVATTMIAAEHAGIRVFATGGIGGVHRAAEDTFDISADLEELGRTNLCVVSAGAKAVLDIPKTLEVLETKGVPVVGYQCDRFPAFYYRDSGCEVSARLDNASEIAALLDHKWDLSGRDDGLIMDGAVLVANPVDEADAMKREDVEGAITEALSQMEVTGRDVTPFLLAKVAELTKGRSKASNMSLLKGNAALAAKIACALSQRLRNC